VYVTEIKKILKKSWGSQKYFEIFSSHILVVMIIFKSQQKESTKKSTLKKVDQKIIFFKIPKPVLYTKSILYYTINPKQVHTPYIRV